jgi:hypothetical protein
MRKIGVYALGVVIAATSVGATIQVANQAGIFWGPVVGMLILIFGSLASVVVLPDR